MFTFIMQRLHYVDGMLAKPPGNRVELEACALQIRMVLEHLVLSTLVANRPGAAAVVAAFAKKRAREVHRLIKRINPHYWPIPFDFERVDSEGGSRWTMAEPSEPYLREGEWGKAYGYCSNLLHAVNPYQYLAWAESGRFNNDQHTEHVAKLKEYSLKIRRLIRYHQTYLSEVDHSLICRIPEDTSVRPTVEVYTRASGIQEPAW